MLSQSIRKALESPSLYTITGKITDVNTLLVNKSDLTAIGNSQFVGIDYFKVQQIAESHKIDYNRLSSAIREYIEPTEVRDNCLHQAIRQWLDDTRPKAAVDYSRIDFTSHEP